VRGAETTKTMIAYRLERSRDDNGGDWGTIAYFKTYKGAQDYFVHKKGLFRIVNIVVHDDFN